MLSFKDKHELCMSFLRYEEFYESPSCQFRDNKFTIAAYMSWYSKTFGEGKFTYTDDWSGFNLPVDVIKHVHARGIDDPNHYDFLMYGVYGIISSQLKDGEKGYLIGCDENDDSIKDHELTHALFYINDDYRYQVKELLLKASSDSKIINEMSKSLLDSGYCQKVVIDEIQAYVTTGEQEYFDEVSDQKRLNKLRNDLKSLHAKYFNDFK